MAQVGTHGETHAETHAGTHTGTSGESGGGWLVTFILSLALWGGVLFGMVMLGHHLANLASKGQ